MEFWSDIIEAANDKWGVVTVALLILFSVAVVCLRYGLPVLGVIFIFVVVAGVAVTAIALALGTPSNGGQGPEPAPKMLKDWFPGK